MDFSPRYSVHMNPKPEQSWFNRFSISSAKSKPTNHSKRKSTLILLRETSMSPSVDQPLKLSIDETPEHLPTTEKLSSKRQSASLYGLNRPILKSNHHSYHSLSYPTQTKD